jgi:VWFA-related protein
MIRVYCLLTIALATAGLMSAADEQVVFRSDVSLVRVDAQVVDRDNRAITGLRAEDFILREEGRRQQIRNFERENMPVDLLFLLDVSASMRPHVQRIADAAHDALRVLGDNDRIGIMVFDRSTRVRLPFRSSRQDVEREFETLLRQERFNGGTDITRGMLDAASYIGRNGRRDARRAIVILTDDETERERDDARVARALENAGAVLSALIAPDAMQTGSYPRQGGGYPGSGGSWPGSGGGGLGGPLGGIILGRRGPYGGGQQGPMSRGSHTHSAGTSEIAQQSGGDSMPVDDASALETTLARIRQRYALHFHLPEGVKPGEERRIDVQLADAARRRYPDAEVRFRRVYLAPGASNAAEPTEVTRSQSRPDSAQSSRQDSRPDTSTRERVSSSSDQVDSERPVIRRRPAISEPDGSRGPNPSVGAPAQDTPEPVAAPATSTQPAGDSNTQQGGWRRVKPGEKP